MRHSILIIGLLSISVFHQNLQAGGWVLKKGEYVYDATAKGSDEVPKFSNPPSPTPHKAISQIDTSVPSPMNFPPLTRAHFTEIVGKVLFVMPTTRLEAPVTLNSPFNPVLYQLKTGADSRAEIVANDGTVIRMGANTLLSFSEKGRGFNLLSGSILLHSPKGLGGGIIQTPSGSAEVLGTTLIVTATSNGGFKTLLLEGNGRVRLVAGATIDLKEGQLIFALPNSKTLPSPINFHINSQLMTSALTKGFRTVLISQDAIDRAAQNQNLQIEKGQAVMTSYLVGDAKDTLSFELIDVNTREVNISQAQLLALQNIVTAASKTYPALDQNFRAPADIPRAPEFYFSDAADQAEIISRFATKHGVAATISLSTLNASDMIAAKNMTFDPGIYDPSLMPPLAGKTGRILLAMDTFSLQRNVSLGARDYSVYAGTFDLLPGITVSASKNAFFLSANSFVLDNFTLNSTKVGRFGSFGGLDLKNGTSLSAGAVRVHAFDANAPISIDNSTLNSASGDDTATGVGGEVYVGGTSTYGYQSGTIDIQNSTIQAGSKAQIRSDNNSINMDTVNVSAGNNGSSIFRTVSVEGTSVTFMNVNFNSRDSATITASSGDVNITGGNFTQTGGGSGTFLTAANTLAVNGTTFNTPQVSMEANTINLANLDFMSGSFVTLKSQNGLLAPSANTGQPSLPGYVNYINNVKYNGALLDNNPHPNITIQAR